MAKDNKFYRASKEDIKELIALFSIGVTDINDPAIKNSAFYKAIQDADQLNLSGTCKGQFEALQQIINIAFAFSKIWDISVSHNKLGSDGPKIAAMLATSKYLTSVSMDFNNFSGD